MNQQVGEHIIVWLFHLKLDVSVFKEELIKMCPIIPQEKLSLKVTIPSSVIEIVWRGTFKHLQGLIPAHLKDRKFFH